MQRNLPSPLSWIRIRAVLLVSSALALCLALGARQAVAVAIYTDRAAWEAAAGGTIVSDTFSGPMGFGASITFDSGVVSTGVGTDTVLTDSNTVDSGRYSGRVDTFNRLPNTFDGITWTFPGSIFAFGADWDDVLTGGLLTLTANFDGLGATTKNFEGELPDPGTGFLGFVGSAPFNSISFGTQNPGDEIFFVDNLSWAQAPEPTAWALLGIGCVAFALALRRQRRTPRRA